MHGRVAKFPVDVDSSKDNISSEKVCESSPDLLHTLKEVLQGINDRVAKNISVAKEKQKKQYDKRHN